MDNISNTETATTTGNQAVTQSRCFPNSRSMTELFPSEILYKIALSLDKIQDLTNLLQCGSRYLKELCYELVYKNMYVSLGRTDAYSSFQQLGESLPDFVFVGKERWTIFRGINKVQTLQNVLCGRDRQPCSWRATMRNIVVDYMYFEVPNGYAWDPLRDILYQSPSPDQPIYSEQRLLITKSARLRDGAPDAFKDILFEIHANSRLFTGQPLHLHNPSYELKEHNLETSRLAMIQESNIPLITPNKIYVTRKMLRQDGARLFPNIAATLAHLVSKKEAPNLELTHFSLIDFRGLGGTLNLVDSCPINISTISNRSVNGHTDDYMTREFQFHMENIINENDPDGSNDHHV